MKWLLSFIPGIISLLSIALSVYIMYLLVRLLRAFVVKLELDNARKYQDLTEEAEFKWEEPQ